MKYRIVLTEPAKDDYLFWKSFGNKSILNKIVRLLKDMSSHPYIGIYIANDAILIVFPVRGFRPLTENPCIEFH